MLWHRTDVRGGGWFDRWHRCFLWRLSMSRMILGRGRARIGIQHFLSRVAELSCRIEHELARGDDSLVFLEATQNFISIILAPWSEHHFAWFEVTIFQSDEDRVLFTASKHR